MLDDPSIQLSDVSVANLAMVTSAILSAGPGTKQNVSNGEWPLILDKDSWFRFLITVLGGAARVGARFRDLPSRGNFPLNTSEASLKLSDDLEVPATQTEMVKRLLKQLYAQLDTRNDVNALEEHAKAIQAKALDDFEWLMRVQIGATCQFLSNFFSRDDLKEIMERILHEAPRVEVSNRMHQMRAQQAEDNAKAKMARVQSEVYHRCLAEAQERGISLARAHANFNVGDSSQHSLEEKTRARLAKHDADISDLERSLSERFKTHKQERKLYFNRLDTTDQLSVICTQAIVLGILEEAELSAPSAKKNKHA